MRVFHIFSHLTLENTACEVDSIVPFLQMKKLRLQVVT